MTRNYLKIALVLLLFLAVPTFLIRAQPYDSSDLRDFLNVNGCPMPCFMGIRPGVTSVDEAIRLLKQSGWTTDVHMPYINGIEWSWSGKQPALINSQTHGYLASSDRMVYSLWVSLNVPAIEVWWASEQPSLVLLKAGSYHRNGQIFSFWYPDKGMNLSSLTETCAAPTAALTTKGSLLNFYSMKAIESIVSSEETDPNVREIASGRLNAKRVC